MPSQSSSFHKAQVLYALHKKAEAVVDLAAVELQRLMKLQLSHAGAGRQHAGLRYKSSAPGDSPAVQTGHLRRSVQIDRKDVAMLRARVGTDLMYGLYLEVGTRKMQARPWVRPAINDWKNTIIPLLKKAPRGK
jgi:HK97 gp10 family phage protein